MKWVTRANPRVDRVACPWLIKKFVDGTIVPHATIKERYLRFPKASFVYSVAM